MDISIWFWVGFLAFIAVMLALDLGVFHRKSHAITFKEASIWSAVWVTLALIFNGWVYWQFGFEKAIEFLTGYVVEYSLSVDNIFVIVLLFNFFHTPDQYQHRVLFWGILGALVMRAALIFAGAALVAEYQWVIYIFGVFLIFTGVKMALSSDKPKDLANNFVLRYVRNHFRVTDNYEGHHFIVVRDGKVWITPLLLALIMVEFTDLIFAVDSIPAILAITQDTFIVFTSNAFAILGLRSMYFMLASLADKFHYLKYGLAAVLTFIGVKMLLAHTAFAISTPASLVVVVIMLSIAIMASLVHKPGTEA
ncbi:MAG: TerC family protein [Dongiaceae bacterium]